MDLRRSSSRRRTSASARVWRATNGASTICDLIAIGITVSLKDFFLHQSSGTLHPSSGIRHGNTTVALRLRQPLCCLEELLRPARREYSTDASAFILPPEEAHRMTETESRACENWESLFRPVSISSLHESYLTFTHSSETRKLTRVLIQLLLYFFTV